MIFRDLIFQTKVVEQRLRARVISHHDQQPSEDCREHRHRELWPAYNLNLAPPQASTEGLFQHSRLISPGDFRYTVPHQMDYQWSVMRRFSRPISCLTLALAASACLLSTCHAQEVAFVVPARVSYWPLSWPLPFSFHR